jgi:hypothetical protein
MRLVETDGFPQNMALYHTAIPPYVVGMPESAGQDSTEDLVKIHFLDIKDSQSSLNAYRGTKA